MCRRHWFALPRKLRNRVWAAYRPGQCDDWNISRAYSEAAKACVRFIAEKEGIEPDLKVYEFLEPKRRHED
jgi:hypothetical protein